jgi:hypothetical protein
MKTNKFMALLVSATASASVIVTTLAAPAQATEPDRVETVTPVQYGASEFSLKGTATAKAKVKSKGGVKIALNVSVKPIPKKEIKRCWTVPVGTKVDMTGIWSGVLSVKKDYRVQAGDNTFCTKKGHGKQVFKKSCDNPAYGVPGGPKGPPPRKMPRIKGKVTFADFHKYVVSQDVEESLSGSAHARVIQYDDKDRIVCEAGGSIHGEGFALSMTTVRVRSRSTTEAVASGGGKLIIKAKADQDLHIRARNAVGVSLDGEVDAYCKVDTTTPPPPPPPPTEEDTPPSMQCHAAQHIWVGEDPMTAVFDLTDPDGTPVSFDKLEVNGPIEVVLTEDTNISGGKRRTLTIRAGWVPEGTEQAYSLKLFGSSGGKQTSCLAQGTVKNNDTGWKVYQQWVTELDARYAR